MRVCDRCLGIAEKGNAAEFFGGFVVIEADEVEYGRKHDIFDPEKKLKRSRRWTSSG